MFKKLQIYKKSNVLQLYIIIIRKLNKFALIKTNWMKAKCRQLHWLLRESAKSKSTTFLISLTLTLPRSYNSHSCTHTHTCKARQVAGIVVAAVVILLLFFASFLRARQIRQQSWTPLKLTLEHPLYA